MRRKHNDTVLVRRPVGAAVALMVLLAIGAYAVMGPTGALAWSEYQQQLTAREAELAKLEEQRASLQNRVNLLDPRHADPDLVGELIRRELNVVNKDEIIVPLK